jgi:hypothetical protein
LLLVWGSETVVALPVLQASLKGRLILGCWCLNELLLVELVPRRLPLRPVRCWAWMMLLITCLPVAEEVIDSAETVAAGSAGGGTGSTTDTDGGT